VREDRPRPASCGRECRGRRGSGNREGGIEEAAGGPWIACAVLEQFLHHPRMKPGRGRPAGPPAPGRVTSSAGRFCAGDRAFPSRNREGRPSQGKPARGRRRGRGSKLREVEVGPFQQASGRAGSPYDVHEEKRPADAPWLEPLHGCRRSSSRSTFRALAAMAVRAPSSAVAHRLGAAGLQADRDPAPGEVR